MKLAGLFTLTGGTRAELAHRLVRDPGLSQSKWVMIGADDECSHDSRDLLE